MYRENTELTTTAVMTDSESETELDVLICVIGPRFPLVGPNVKSLPNEWEKEPGSYLGLVASGLPNYFMFPSPFCSFGNGLIAFYIELQGAHIAEFSKRRQKEDIKTYDVRSEAVHDMKEYHINNCMEYPLYLLISEPHGWQYPDLWPSKFT